MRENVRPTTISRASSGETPAASSAFASPEARAVSKALEESDLSPRLGVADAADDVGAECGFAGRVTRRATSAALPMSDAARRTTIGFTGQSDGAEVRKRCGGGQTRQARYERAELRLLARVRAAV